MFEKEYQLMFEKFGEMAQIDVFIEEMAELIQALSKIKRLKQFPQHHSGKDEKYFANFYEELADVANLFDQIIWFYNCRDTVDEIRKQKIGRTMERFFQGNN
jgi:NTP pyrophosphatase (non-canonical NTP hydrolase)